MGYTPEVWAGEAVSSTLASRETAQGLCARLSQGPQHFKRVAEPEDAAEAGLVTHRLISPSDTLEML